MCGGLRVVGILVVTGNETTIFGINVAFVTRVRIGSLVPMGFVSMSFQLSMRQFVQYLECYFGEVMCS